MALCFEIVEIPGPNVDPGAVFDAAQLIVNTIGNYSATKTPEDIMALMAGRLTVAAIDGYDQVIGTAGLRVLHAGRALIEDVAIDARKQRRGIGRSLIESIESLAIERGLTRLELESSLTAVGFYHALDYESKDDPRVFTKRLTQ